MTVQELIDKLSNEPGDNELIIIDVTNPDPEEAINLYVKEVSTEQEGTTYLLLND
jgi:hypothetical protein